MARLDRPTTINTNLSNALSLSVAGVVFPERTSKNIQYRQIIILYRNGDCCIYKMDQNNRATVLSTFVLDTPNGIENCVWSRRHQLLVRKNLKK